MSTATKVRDRFDSLDLGDIVTLVVIAFALIVLLSSSCEVRMQFASAPSEDVR